MLRHFFSFFLLRRHVVCASILQRKLECEIDKSRTPLTPSRDSLI